MAYYDDLGGLRIDLNMDAGNPPRHKVLQDLKEQYAQRQAAGKTFNVPIDSGNEQKPDSTGKSFAVAARKRYDQAARYVRENPGTSMLLALLAGTAILAAVTDEAPERAVRRRNVNDSLSGVPRRRNRVGTKGRKKATRRVNAPKRKSKK